LTKIYVEDIKKWKNALVEEVDVEEQQAKVRKYGSGDIIQVPAYFLKVLK
jgi:hypothetical protein